MSEHNIDQDIAGVEWLDIAPQAIFRAARDAFAWYASSQDAQRLYAENRRQMEKKTKTRDLAADIECYLLKDWYMYYRREFLIECERVGLKFMRDLIDPDDQEGFTKAFDDLVALGCRP